MFLKNLIKIPLNHGKTISNQNHSNQKNSIIFNHESYGDKDLMELALEKQKKNKEKLQN